ncbi:MAG: DUF4982 domain-containing protein [Clostridia bacterium]|nr:DUF4982 domain-containing protein [Clostridia bacterium]
MERFFASPAALREEVFFGFDWGFALTDSTDMPAEQTDYRPVQLPHDWSVDYPVGEDEPTCGSGGYARAGIGWYRRRFSVHLAPGMRHAIRFDGVYMNCGVWLNGARIGGHVYGYTGFELDMDGALREGENELLICVDNSRQPGSRWYTGSGITRNAWLVRTPQLRLRDGSVYITTEISGSSAQVSIRAEAAGADAPGALALSVQITGRDGEAIAQTEAAMDGMQGLARAELPAVRRWDVEDPYLYTARVQLMQGGSVIDAVTVPFGVREIAYSAEQGFLLNGRKLIMQGVCLHHDGGCVGAAVPPAVWARRLKKLKAMGCNALRCSHNPPDPALLTLADEMGFVVMDEAFDEWHYMKGKEFGSNTHESRGYSEWFDACAADDMRAMIERDRNHPSIVMWSIGNEVREQTLPDGPQYARMLGELCRSLDPTRPFTQACDQMKAEPVPATEEFLAALDIVGVNYVDRWRERTETFFDEEKREHPERLYLGTEDIAVNGRRGDYRLKTEESVWGPTPYYAKMLKAEKLWKYVRTRPFVIGSFMWTGVDYLGECFWPDKGSSAGVLDTCGYEKDGYHFYKSQWVKDEPVLYLCPHMNADRAPGSIYPLVCYTNCFSVELFVDGVSYGVKAYEFPNQGMAKEWAHFDRPLAPITTNDLHLTWDVPCTRGEIVAVGRDSEGREIIRTAMRPAGQPERLQVTADRSSLTADGRDVVQLEIALLDGEGRVAPHMDMPVSVSVEGGALLGMDNGRQDDRTMYRTGSRETYCGLAYAIVRAPREAGQVTITVAAEGLEPVIVRIDAQ